MRPRAVLLMFVFGAAKIGVLVRFSAVAPIWKLNRSLIGMRLMIFVFTVFDPGPRRTPLPRLPITPGRGLTRSACPLAPAMARSVESAWMDAGRLEIDGSRICVNPGK